MPDLQDTDLAVFLVAQLLEGIQDVLQLAFQVQHGRSGLLFVRRPDCRQDFQGAGQRCRIAALQTERL